MKYLLFLLTLVLALGTTASVFAQSEACLQAAYGATTVKKAPGTNRYVMDTSVGKKLWFWISPQSYLNTYDGVYGTWSCKDNGVTSASEVTFTKTGVLPKCVQSLTSLSTTDDPNEFRFLNKSDQQTIAIWLSNNRYKGLTTGSIGNWSCDSNGVITLSNYKKPPTTDPDNIPPKPQTDPDNIPPKDTSSSQATDIPLKIKLNNPLKVDTVQDAIKLFMDAVVKIAIPFIVVFFIWSGMQFILAQGNQEKLRKAKRTFWFTVIGTLLILGAWAITDAIVGTINSIAG